MSVIFEGGVSKMKAEMKAPVQYTLGDVLLNDFLGEKIQIKSRTEKLCIHCERSIKKTFGQGYCYPCFQSLARCDTCIVKPEKCHYALGTCREPEWGEENCLIEHSVYLSNTSGVKVGITRRHQKHTRWIDQGALAALEIGTVPGRLESGLVEVGLKERFADKTNWRVLLTGKSEAVDLMAAGEEVISDCVDLFEKHGGSVCTDLEEVKIQYPVERYLEKAKSANLDKDPEVVGTLHGIRGQYLLIGEVGINVRKYQGYIWSIEKV